MCERNVISLFIFVLFNHVCCCAYFNEINRALLDYPRSSCQEMRSYPL